MRTVPGLNKLLRRSSDKDKSENTENKQGNKRVDNSGDKKKHTPTTTPAHRSTNRKITEIVKSPLIEDLPPLRDCEASQRNKILVQKLKSCSTPLDDPSTLEMKTRYLKDVKEYLESTNNWAEDATFISVGAMFDANIFRVLPRRANKFSLPMETDFETDGSTGAAALKPHMQAVYDIFSRYVLSAENPLLKTLITEQFIVKLLRVCEVEDPREREYLKGILHRVYGRVMHLRLFIRKSMDDVFLRCLNHPDDTFIGVAELLEVRGSIINGFAKPLKDEHKKFLIDILLPLHRLNTTIGYQEQLVYCVVQYANKDATLIPAVIRSLLRNWSIRNSTKEVMFIFELYQLLEMCTVNDFSSLAAEVFTQLAECIKSPHCQVAEKALYLWNNKSIMDKIRSNKEAIYPLVIPALYQNCQHHWNTTVSELTYDVSKILAEVDPALFDSCTESSALGLKETETANHNRTIQWQKFRAKA